MSAGVRVQDDVVGAAACSLSRPTSAGRETEPPAVLLELNAGKIVRFVIESQVSYVGEVDNRAGESCVTHCRIGLYVLSGGVGKMCLRCSVLTLV